MELELHQLQMKYERLRIADPGRQARLLASLTENGQQSPVLVVRAGADRYVLIDGYRRVEALRRLGSDTVGAVVLEMSEEEALVFCHRQQQASGRSALEDGWLIRELTELFGLGLGEVGLRLGRSKSWVSRRLALVRQLPEQVQGLVRTGKLCAYAAMKYLVPLARANKKACVDLAERIGGKKLSVRQVGELYVAWRLADEVERQRIVDNPLLYLKVAEEVSRPAEDPEEAKRDALLRDMDVLCGVCHRARRRVRDAEGELDHPTYRRRLKQGWRESRLAFERLEERMEEGLRAGCGHEDGSSEAEG